MAPRKLSDSDKSALIDLYKQPGQTTTTLAEQFEVSNSTVSRILKSTIPPEEYRELISQKRMATSDKVEPAKKTAKASKQKPAAEKSTKKTRTRSAKSKVEPSASDTAEVEEASPAKTVQKELPKLKSNAADKTEAKSETGGRRRRRRRNAGSDEDEQLPLLSADAETAETSETSKPKLAAPVLASAELEEDDDDEDDLKGLDETLGDDFGDDDDLDEEDDDDDLGEVEAPKPKLQSKDAIEIMPLGAAVLPKPCYLVVDMRSELITRPLAEFADLGQVPSAEEKSKTLPVFDNHRVARRFSRNKQRVIKVPDGSLITRTSPYLQAKGITRLLVDGQVFDLAGVE